MHEDSFGRLNPDLLEGVFVQNRQHDGLSELFDLLVESANIRVLGLGLLLEFHGLDAVVIFAGQRIQNEEGVLVDTDDVVGLESVDIDESGNGQEHLQLDPVRFDEWRS